MSTPDLFAGTFTTIVLATLAVFAITWTIVFSTLMGSHIDSQTKWSQRVDKWGFDAEGKDRGFIRGKIATGYTCPVCVSFWVSIVVVSAIVWVWPWQLGVTGWVVTLAVWTTSHWTLVAYHYLTAKT